MVLLREIELTLRALSGFAMRFKQLIKILVFHGRKKPRCGARFSFGLIEWYRECRRDMPNLPIQATGFSQAF